VSFMPDTTGSALVGTLLRGAPPAVARRTAGDGPERAFERRYAHRVLERALGASARVGARVGPAGTGRFRAPPEKPQP